MKLRTISGIALVACGIAVTGISAADWADSDGSCFKKDDKQLTIGFNTWFFGPNVGFDMAFHDAISGGAAMGFNWWGIGSWNYYHIPIVIRAAFHPFNLAVLADKIKVRDRLDVYAGLSSGWQVGFVKWDGSGDALSEPAVGGFFVRERIGASWYFNPNFYANVEEGSGLGWFNLGLGFKF